MVIILGEATGNLTNMSRRLSAKKKRFEPVINMTSDTYLILNRRTKSYPEELLRDSLLKLAMKQTKSQNAENDDIEEDFDEIENKLPYLHHQKRLKSCGQFQNALVTLAIRDGDNIQLWRLLSRKDVDSNYIDGLGLQPIHYACIYGDIEILKTLLQHNVNINSATTQGDCPLDLAVREGNFEIAQYLICKGAKVKSIVDGIKDSSQIKQRPASYSGSSTKLKGHVKLKKTYYEI